jgi:hypothetical protein
MRTKCALSAAHLPPHSLSYIVTHLTISICLYSIQYPKQQELSEMIIKLYTDHYVHNIEQQELSEMIIKLYTDHNVHNIEQPELSEMIIKLYTDQLCA